MRAMIRAVERFFFAPTDTATFGLIRISAALMTLYVHLVYSYDLYDFFGKTAWYNHDTSTLMRMEMPVVKPTTEWNPPAPITPGDLSDAERYSAEAYRSRWGYYPYHLHDRGQYLWSVWFHVTDPQTIAVVHAGILVAMLLFALGLWTPVTGVISWLGALCYVNRSHVSLFGMDTMMIIALFYLAIGHLGVPARSIALSLDRWLWRQRAARRGGSELEANEPRAVSIGFALRMIQIHFCVIYFAAGVSKLLGGSWWNGTALWSCLANYEFAPMNHPLYMDFLTWLCKHRWQWELAMHSQVIFTLFLEVGFPFMVWSRRLRWAMVVGAVFLHTGIALLMGLTGFGVMMLTLLLSFVPPETVRGLLGMVSETSTGFRPSPIEGKPVGAI